MTATCAAPRSKASQHRTLLLTLMRWRSWQTWARVTSYQHHQSRPGSQLSCNLGRTALVASKPPLSMQHLLMLWAAGRQKLNMTGIRSPASRESQIQTSMKLACPARQAAAVHRQLGQATRSWTFFRLLVSLRRQAHAAAVMSRCAWTWAHLQVSPCKAISLCTELVHHRPA